MSFWRRLLGKGKASTLRPQRLDYLNEALALERQGDFEAALTSYRLALRDNPHDTRILQNMAIAFTKTGQPDEAIRHYRRALELDPTLVGAHYGVAFLLLKRGDAGAGRGTPARLPGPAAQGTGRRALGPACGGGAARTPARAAAEGDRHEARRRGARGGWRWPACSDLSSSDDRRRRLAGDRRPPARPSRWATPSAHRRARSTGTGTASPRTIVWSTPDTATIAVDSATGRGPRASSGHRRRVQATTDGLVAPAQHLHRVAHAGHADPGAAGHDRRRHPADTASPPLVARLEAFNPPGPDRGPARSSTADRARLSPTPPRRTVGVRQRPAGRHGLDRRRRGTGDSRSSSARMPGVTPPDSADRRKSAPTRYSEQPAGPRVGPALHHSRSARSTGPSGGL